MTQMKLADALLRRKELQEKVDQLRNVKDKDLYDVKMQRKQITETVDDIIAQVPKVELNQVTSEHDYYANKLRLIDAAIQRTNWSTDIEVDSKVWANFESK